MNKLQNYVRGLKNGLPIAIGYFAVSFSLGILMRNTGLDPLQGLVMSLTNNTSAGQAASLEIIAYNGTYFEMALSQLVINLRYFLMSTALAAHLAPGLSLGKRLIIGFDVTDEIFASLIGQGRSVNEYFAFGLSSITIPCWAAGTALGIVFGDILPSSIVSCLSVALYAMFLAVVIPAGRKNLKIMILVIFSMAMSYIFSLDFIRTYISSGSAIIILTVAISAIASLVWPVEEA